MATRGLVDGGSFNGAGSTLIRRMNLPEWDRLEAQTRRTVAASRQRHLQAYTAKNFKDLLRLCDVHGVDHMTPAGATPLMMAARAGNLPLVQALLAKGADPELRDEFGHTAWLCAVSRAMEESGFAARGLSALDDALAPAVLDVQTDGRLVRIELHQGDYWVLTLMLAGLKTQWSACVLRTHEVWKCGEGFFAEQLHLVLERLPPHIWSDKRRKRAYVNQVLARGEVGSSYRPASQLLARAWHGHYLPNPAMLIRQGEGWVAVYDSFRLDWLDAGCGSEDRFLRTPAGVVARPGRDEMTTDKSTTCATTAIAARRAATRSPMTDVGTLLFADNL